MLQFFWFFVFLRKVGMKIRDFFQKLWPFLFILTLVFIFFWKFFLRGLLPFPGDIIVGLYYPYLDYKWGSTTGIPVKNPLLSDIPSLLYPWRSLVVDQFKNLALPLWNPFYYLGMPLLANFQSAVFNLGNLFFFFFEKPLAWSLGVICQPIITLGFTYLYLRNKTLPGSQEKISQLACLFGASVFAFCGFSIAWLEYNVLGWTAAFLPLHLFLIDKIFKKRKSFYGYLLSLSLTLQVFSGYLPIVIYSWIILFLYIIFFYFQKETQENFSGLKIVIKSLILAFLLGSFQILPGLELIRLSIRSIDPIASESSGGFFPWQNFVTFLAPDYFGNPATYNFWGRPFFDNFFGFVGIPALFLAVSVISISLKKHKETTVWSLILFFSLILITKNPISLFFLKINFLGLKGGVSARALFITDFSLAILSTYGFENLVKGKNNKNFINKLAVLLLIFGILFVYLWYMSCGKVNFGFTDPRQHTVAGRNLILPTMFFLSLVFLMTGAWLFRKSTRSKLLLGFCLFAVSIFSLFYQANKYLSFSKKEFIFPETPVITFLKNQKGPFRIEPNDVFPQNFWLPYGLEAVSGYDALLPLRTGEYLSAIDKGKIQKKISRVNLLTNFSSPLFKLLNVKFILTKKRTFEDRFSPEGKFLPLYLENPRLKLVFEDKTVGIFEDLELLPRAWLINDYLVENEKNKIIQVLSSAEFNPKVNVVLEESPKWGVGVPDFSVNKDVVESEVSEPGLSLYQVTSEKRAILFESAAYYPGWKVSVDGKEEKLLRANYAFRAVAIPPGIHRVKFYYKSNLVLLGLLLSISSFVYLVYSLITNRPKSAK